MESCIPKLLVSFPVLLQRKQSPLSQREYVTGKRLTLRVVDFHKVIAAGLQQFHSFDREPGQVYKSCALIQETDKRHQVQAGRRPGAVGQRCGEDRKSTRLNSSH